MNHRLLHRWAREEALPLPSRTHPQNQKQTSVVYTEELTDLHDTYRRYHLATLHNCCHSDLPLALSRTSLVLRNPDLSRADLILFIEETLAQWLM